MTDLTKQSAEDLMKEVAKKREALRTFRFGESGSRSRNVREGRSLRRDIARMMTELNTRRSKANIASSKKNA